MVERFLRLMHDILSRRRLFEEAVEVPGLRWVGQEVVRYALEFV